MIACTYCGPPVGGGSGPLYPHFVWAFAIVNTPYGIGDLASLGYYAVGNTPYGVLWRLLLRAVLCFVF